MVCAEPTFMRVQFQNAKIRSYNRLASSVRQQLVDLKSSMDMIALSIIKGTIINAFQLAKLIVGSVLEVCKI